MNDVDTLRAALRTAPAQTLTTPDLDRVMAAGGRLRRRRSLAIASCAAVAVLVVATGATVLLRGMTTPAAVDVGAAPSVAATTAAPCAEPQVPACQLGDVIPTGIVGAAGELVFSVVRIESAAIPETHFGVMAGHRDPAGTITGQVLANEVSGPDLAPGFHAVQAATDGIPPFGYYVGPAARITGQAGTQTITARQAPWSVNPAVVVFWFERSDDVASLAAFDATGASLPAGNPEVGHG